MIKKLTLVGMVLAATINWASCKAKQSFYDYVDNHGPLKTAENVRYQDSPECNPLIKKIGEDSQNRLLLFDYKYSPQLTGDLISAYRESKGQTFYCSQDEGRSYKKMLFTPEVPSDLIKESIKVGWRLAAIIRENEKGNSFYLWSDTHLWGPNDDTYMTFPLP